MASRSEEAEAASLIDRLARFARKLGLNDTDCMDAALQAYADGLDRGVPEWHYTSTCLKNAFLQNKRDRLRRNLDYKWTFLPGEDEPEELKRMAVDPSQLIRCDVNDVLRAIKALPEPYRSVITLVSLEYSVDEIAERTDTLKKDVYWQIARARKLLRERALHFETKKRGHPDFIGVRKDRHRWSATFRSKGESYYLGYFSTAAEAAIAYDRKAIQILGDRARVNFPHSLAANGPGSNLSIKSGYLEEAH